MKNTTTKDDERKVMSNKFDELTKSLAQSVTRRAALRRFGVGLAGMALACFGLANRTEARGNCWQAGVECYRGFSAGNPSRDCRRCCNGYGCVPMSGSFGLIGKVCTCQ